MSGTTPTSSSRRSSINRSTRSVFRQPPWKASSLANKNSPTASLSIIVAEPEQGAPLKSATESVAPLASTSGENEEALSVRKQSDRSSRRRSSFELPLHARTETWFSSLSRKDSKKPVTHGPDSMDDQPTASTSSLPPYSPRVIVPQKDNITVDPVPEPLTKSEPLSIPEHPTQTQGSWVSSPSSSSSGSPPPFASTIPKTPPSVIPTPRGSPTQTPNIVPTSPPISHVPSSTNIPTISTVQTPLDDPVPSSLSPDNGASTPKNPPLVQMTSKFTLSIPLLGRPKVPLGSVMGLESKKGQVPVAADKLVQSKQSSNSLKGDSTRDSRPQVVPSSESSIAPSSSAPLPPLSSSPSVQPTGLTSSNHSLDPNVSVTPLANTPEAEMTTTTDATTTTALDPASLTKSDEPVESTSWWGYVGWGSTSTPPTGPGVLVSVDAPAANEELKSAPEVVPISSPTTQLTADASAVPVSTGGGLAEDSKAAEPITEEAKAEVQSGDQQQPLNSSAPVWYAPWAWYSSTDANGPVLPEPGAKTVLEDVQVEAPVPMVQEPEPEPEPISTVSPEPQGDTPIAASMNPITANMEVNWGSWASFFSSRRMMVKTVGYKTIADGAGDDVKRDEDGMEVMDIDDDDDDKQRVGGENELLNDSGHPGQVLSSVTTPLAVAKTKPLMLKTSNSRDSDSSDVSGTLSQSVPKYLSPPTTHGVSSTPKKGDSGSTTPVPLPSPSREKVQAQSLPTSPTTSTAAKKTNIERAPSPAPSKKSISAPPPPPNLVLPTWQQIFHTAPRNVVPLTVKPQEDQGVGGKLLGKTMRFVSDTLFARDAHAGSSKLMKGKEKETSRGSSETFVDGEAKKWAEERFKEFGKGLPKTWQILEEAELGMDTTTPTTPTTYIPNFGFCSPGSAKKGSSAVASDVVEDGGSSSDGLKDVLRGCKRVVVIGIHGWFPGPMLRTVVGEPTGTSIKFANMTELALQHFENEHGVKLEKITKIPLEGDGTIDKRVERLYNNLTANEDWMKDIHESDAIIVSTHSQGSIVSTHLLNRLIQDNHITTARNQHPHHTTSFGTGAESFPSAIGAPESVVKRTKVQRVCCLALCGIHLGPLRYLSSSTLVGPYIQYFESIAARELFEFQNTESAVSKAYVKVLQNVLDHGVKMLYIASLNDQVVPLYSGLFTAVSHPLILRALYIDGDAYHSSDFLSNLLVLLLRILNSGIPDSGLIAHLSEATAGSLIGVGHSTAYEELSTFSLAVKYLFLANEGMPESTELLVEPFNASQEQNDYEIPWSLRDIIADERVSHFFSRDIVELKDAFREWHPKTSILRDLKRKLQPITRLPHSTVYNSLGSSVSKL